MEDTSPSFTLKTTTSCLRSRREEQFTYSQRLATWQPSKNLRETLNFENIIDKGVGLRKDFIYQLTRGCSHGVGYSLYLRGHAKISKMYRRTGGWGLGGGPGETFLAWNRGCCFKEAYHSF